MPFNKKLRTVRASQVQRLNALARPQALGAVKDGAWWQQGAVTRKAATGAQKFFQKLATVFQAIVLMWQQKDLGWPPRLLTSV